MDEKVSEDNKVGTVVNEALEIGLKYGVELIEKQIKLPKIPDLKDVSIDEAMRMLKEDLNLIATSAVAHPCPAYADESELRVVYTEPRFGSRVQGKTAVKVYYLTEEVIKISKELLKSVVEEVSLPRVIGLNLYEAREDLERLGLRVSEKKEKPSLKFIDKEDCQVTRVTYPNDKKIGSKLKTGERVWLYYVTEETITESVRIKETKEKDRQEKVDNIVKKAKGAAIGVRDGAKGAAHNLAQNTKKPFAKKKEKNETGDE